MPATIRTCATRLIELLDKVGDDVLAEEDALNEAMQELLAIPGLDTLPANPVRDHVAAVSVGIYQGTPVLDLDYPEDSDCDTDMNVVMTGSGGIVEIQGTAEREPFTRPQMNTLTDLAEAGIRRLIAAQQGALAA